MTFRLSVFLIILAGLVQSCIGDDFVNDTVDPVLRIISAVDTLEIDSSYQFEYLYLNNIGQEELIDVEWSCSDNDVLEITPDGLGSALSMGTAEVMVSYNNSGILYTDSKFIVVGEATTVTLQSVTGKIITTSSYVLEGDFEYTETNTGVHLTLADNYRASSSLPGLYVYLSNNKNSVANAYEIGSVTVFNGAHEYQIDGVGFSDFQFIVYFCKPFNVKVGEGIL